jgi:N-acetylglucosaminyldiphosphoundecaprenol N-acetyl-beta-D-mannosaminyltransferase
MNKGVEGVIISGVRIDKVSREDVLMQIGESIAQNKFLQVATANAAFILLARKDNRYKKVLNSCDLVIPDGSGISIASRLLYGVNVERYAGADLVFDVLELAQEQCWRVAVLCRADGLSKWADVRLALADKYPQLECFGVDIKLSELNLESKKQVLSAQNEHTNCAIVRERIEIKEFLRKNSVEIVIANFGAPTQEYVLAELTDMQASGLVTIGVGGALDFLTGKVARAPMWLRKIGCEWIWRTIQQPNRLRKMCASVIVFPIVITWDKLRK